jgi:hypothetical protein
VTLLMEQGAAPAGVALSAMPPGRFGLADRAYYEGLQVDLLEVDWSKAAKACRIGVGAAHPVQSRKSGSEARNRRRRCAERRP